MIKLSPRLEAIAKMVDFESVVADIGTDHGYLPIWLVQSNVALKAYAIDNKKTPLLSAQENIVRNDVNNVITILSNGLNDLPVDCNCLILAGLGSATIAQVLFKGHQKLSNIQTIIVQANVGIEKIRAWALQNHYYIENEISVSDNEIIYDIIKLKQGYQPMSNDELLFGPIFLKNIDSVFMEKWRRHLENSQKIYDEIPSSNPKKEFYRQHIHNIKRIINVV